MPTSEPSRPTAVVCDADTAARHRVRRTLEDAGYEVVVESFYGVDALLAAEREQPDLVVLDLGSAGALGVYVIAAIRHAAPCEVIAFAPFDGLAEAAEEAGAAVALATNDLVGLAHAIRGLRAPAPVSEEMQP